jgi:hypothetical protein
MAFDLSLTGNVSSEDRTYTTKHGTVSTMRTAKHRRQAEGRARGRAASTPRQWVLSRGSCLRDSRLATLKG